MIGAVLSEAAGNHPVVLSLFILTLMIISEDWYIYIYVYIWVNLVCNALRRIMYELERVLSSYCWVDKFISRCTSLYACLLVEHTHTNYEEHAAGV